jgi:hypothetical protein
MSAKEGIDHMQINLLCFILIGLMLAWSRAALPENTPP